MDSIVKRLVTGCDDPPKNSLEGARNGSRIKPNARLSCGYVS